MQQYLTRTTIPTSALKLYSNGDESIYFVNEDGYEYDAPMLYFLHSDGAIRAMSLIGELRASQPTLSPPSHLALASAPLP